MKTWLIFVVISCVALMRGTGYAASPQPSSQVPANASSEQVREGEHAPPTDERNHGGKTSADTRNHRFGSDRSRASVIRPSAPKQLPNPPRHSTSRNASGGPMRGGLVQSETANPAPPVRPPTVASPQAPSLENVRHHGANPAIIGGSANSDARNTGALNGTRMPRKP